MKSLIFRSCGFAFAIIISFAFSNVSNETSDDFITYGHYASGIPTTPCLIASTRDICYVGGSKLCTVIKGGATKILYSDNFSTFCLVPLSKDN